MLVDPWLVGQLTFGGLDFVYAGSKRVARPETIDIDALAAETDIILLTQGIDDHAHKWVQYGYCMVAGVLPHHTSGVGAMPEREASNG